MTERPPPDSDVAESREGGRKFAAVFGGAIALVGLAVAIAALVRAWDALVEATFVAWAVALAVACGVAGMLVIGSTWSWILHRYGSGLPTATAIRIYFFGQLGKYVPGGLWTVVGRGELAAAAGVRREDGYASTVTSMATTYTAAAVVGAVFIAVGDTDGTQLGLAIAAAVALAAVVIVCLSDPVMRRINALASRFRSMRPLPSSPPSRTATLILMATPAWLLIGTATWLVGIGLGYERDLPAVLAATALSWLVGFLIVPLPGGLGAREAVFIALIGGSTDEAAAIAVIARAVFVAVDLLGAAGSWMVETTTGRRTST